MTHSNPKEPIERIVSCSIHPGIGIARLGNSPDEYFIGSEVPGHGPIFLDETTNLFRDKNGLIKRQAARFRIYGYDDKGNVIKELTAEDADITWIVHLANKKTSAVKFESRYAPENPDFKIELRNKHVPQQKRNELINDPGPRSINGINENGKKYKFNEKKLIKLIDEKFSSIILPLGEIRTDEKGRLLVLGGFGVSETPDSEAFEITNYANNDGWYDDTSDGPVKATVIMKSGKKIPVKDNAWVIVAPPKFAPYHYPIISLYDVMRHVAFDQNWLKAPEKVSFKDDIYPILFRAVEYKWLNSAATRGHGISRSGSFLDPDILKKLADNNTIYNDLRRKIFDRLRDANPRLYLVKEEDQTEEEKQQSKRMASPTYMPQLSGDDGDYSIGSIRTWMALLPRQYENMRRWNDGNFESDYQQDSNLIITSDLKEIPVKDQPTALDRASLDLCIGGPFFPGIEMTHIAWDPSTYDGKAFRINSSTKAGDITKRMAIPWQADFYECADQWWPPARPDNVIPEDEYLKVVEAWKKNPLQAEGEEPIDFAVSHQERWDRGIPANPNIGRSGDEFMVKFWSDFGFIVPRPTPDNKIVYVETERRPYAGLNYREYFYIMMNIESHPEFLTKAHELTEFFLDTAWNKQSDPDFPDQYLFFKYSREAFLSRMEQIYDDYVRNGDAYDPKKSNFRTREQVIYSTLQLAPFNQIDGGWLRNVAKAGPIDEVRSLLFEIWMDEEGNGNPAQNHSNLYTQLLSSLGINLPAVNSYEYAYYEDFVDDAFALPLFELVISQFSEEYFPEILGMTLYLEWEVLELKPAIATAKHLDIDPHFYALHVGIDNAVNGHGAKAKEAVMSYLNDIKSKEGEEAMQNIWRRIWKGYITFANTGNIGEQIRERNSRQRNIVNRVVDMIERIKHYAMKNHGKKMLGQSGHFINDMFDYPIEFLQELVKQGYLIPGQPERSPFFRLLSFDGPMYKVFTQEEIKLWEDYVRSLISIPKMSTSDSMVLLISKLKEDRQFIDIILENPKLDIEIKGIDINTNSNTTKPILWWISQNQQGSLLYALTHSPNLVKIIEQNKEGDANESSFFTEWITAPELIGIFRQQAVIKTINPQTGIDDYISTGDENWIEVVRRWINLGCSLPTNIPKPILRITSITEKNTRMKDKIRVPKVLLYHMIEEDKERPGKIWGMGSVH